MEWRPAWAGYSDCDEPRVEGGVHRRSGRRGLSPPGIAHGPGYEIAGGLNVASGGGAPGGGIAIVLFARKITEGGIEQVHGLAEAAFPAGANIDGRMVVDVLAIVDGGAPGFIDGAVNLFDGVALIAHHVAPIGPIEQGAGIAQIADGVQVVRVCTAIGGTRGRRRREHAADFITELVVAAFADHGDGIVDETEGTVAPLPGHGVILFAVDIGASTFQKADNFAEAAAAAQVGIDGRVIVNVAAVPAGGVVDFANGADDIVGRDVQVAFDIGLLVHAHE